METAEDLFKKRGMVNQALKRRKPGFNETHHGFRTFAKLLGLEFDEKSGATSSRAWDGKIDGNSHRHPDYQPQTKRPQKSPFEKVQPIVSFFYTFSNWLI
ncbi:MAG: hypothetical protein ACXWUF_21170 [Methylomagnum sp.]